MSIYRTLFSSYLRRQGYNIMSTLSYSSSSNATVKISHVDDAPSIRLIGINRPSKRNCVNHSTSLQLFSAFQSVENDDTIQLAILYGEGGSAFCAGYDLSEVSAANVPLSEDYNKNEPGPMGPSRMSLKKPLIAAIAGPCVAGGLELSLLADMRVGEQSSKYGVLCRRFGVPLIDGGTVRLPRVIGLSRALDLILTGRTVDAQEAFNIGLINRLVPDGQSLSEAIKLAKDILRFPYECMNTDRLSAHFAVSNSVDDGLKREYDYGRKIIALESIQGAQHFIEQKQGRGGKYDDIKHGEKSKL
jgi:enoyl-CoA hydratase/carnithine racemase